MIRKVTYQGVDYGSQLCSDTHLCQHCRVCQLWGKVDGVLLVMAMVARIPMTMMMIRSDRQKHCNDHDKDCKNSDENGQKLRPPCAQVHRRAHYLHNWEPAHLHNFPKSRPLVYRHNANQIYMGYIYLLSRPLVCVLLSAIVYSQLNLNPNKVHLYKIPPTQPTSC